MSVFSSQRQASPRPSLLASSEAGSSSSCSCSGAESLQSHLAVESVPYIRHAQDGSDNACRGRTLTRTPAEERCSRGFLVCKRQGSSSRSAGSGSSSSSSGTEVNPSRIKRRRLDHPDVVTVDERGAGGFDPRGGGRSQAEREKNDAKADEMWSRFGWSSLGVELQRAATFDDSIDLSTFGAHRDTFALLDFRREKGLEEEEENGQEEQLAQGVSGGWSDQGNGSLDYETYESVKMSCRSWSEAVAEAVPIEVPSVSRLPPEVIEKILVCLDPWSFDTARHTCRSWMVTSLDQRLLREILSRGGWASAVDLDKMVQTTDPARGMADHVSDAWLMSKRLATECSLSPDCNGSGTNQSSGDRPEALTLTSKIDFRSGFPRVDRHGRDSPPKFTISVCSSFLLVSSGETIRIYALRRSADTTYPEPYGGYISFLTTMVCPSSVLKVSMDTSCQRFAVAALLEGRMGIVFDLDAIRSLSTSDQPKSGDPTDKVEDACSRRLIAEPMSSDRNTYSTALDSIHPRLLYQNLCTNEDPPCSIAICPNRRSVAFGSRVGIELHWLDALTGSDVKRWFPLSVASDSLYFVPSSNGTETLSRMRIIPSTEYSPREHLVRNSPWQDNSWLANVPAPMHDDNDTSRLVHDVEHCQTVPLSDGKYLIYVDPKTPLLCLGLMTMSAEGSRKLIRSVEFLPPPGEIGNVAVPNITAPAQELRWGLRLAVAYGDRLWLYVVPPDLFLQWERNALKGIVCITGMQIGLVPGCSSIAMNASSGDLTISAFSTNGIGYTYQLAGSGGKAVTERQVRSYDGVILTLDPEGDIVLPDCPPESVSKSAQMAHVGADHHQKYDPSARHQGPSQDAEGDTLMTDADLHHLISVKEIDEGYASADDEYHAAGGIAAIHIPPMSGWSGDNGDGEDWVPEYLADHGHAIEDEGLGVDVLGMCRCECEIIGG